MRESERDGLPARHARAHVNTYFEWTVSTARLPPPPPPPPNESTLCFAFCKYNINKSAIKFDGNAKTFCSFSIRFIFSVLVASARVRFCCIRSGARDLPQAHTYT